MKAKIYKRIGLTALFIMIAAIIMLASLFNSTAAFAGEISETGEKISREDADNESVVFSYTDIFQTYYDVILEKAEESGNNDIFSFEEFCDKYYYSGMDLPSYTDAVIKNDNLEELKTDISVIDSENPSFNDADYILSTVDYSITPASVFVRIPVYSLYDYSSIKEGDIIHETDTIFFDAGHTAVIYNTAKNGAYGNYLQTIEAVGGGVQFGFLDDTRMVDFGVIILRVQGVTAGVVNNVKYFCHMQLGKNYSLNIFRLNTNINSDRWYCSEMVYAAYKYSGIDIGVKKNSSGGDVYLQLGCLPADINNSYNTYSVHISGFLDIAIVRKSGSSWVIEVNNYLSYDITFQYNSKMCFKGDAESWSGLNHITDSIVYAKDKSEVIISENLFATSVVFSWVDQGKRMITYGYQLNTNKTMTVVYTIKA